MQRNKEANVIEHAIECKGCEWKMLQRDRRLVLISDARSYQIFPFAVRKSDHESDRLKFANRAH